MIFNDGIVEMESIKTSKEARAYVWFLSEERVRHKQEVAIASRKAEAHRTCGGPYHDAKAEFYDSAAYRHQCDVEATGKRIVEVCGQWGLPMEAD